MRQRQFEDNLSDILDMKKFLVPKQFLSRTVGMTRTQQANILTAGVLLALKTLKGENCPSRQLEVLSRSPLKNFLQTMLDHGWVKSDKHYIKGVKSIKYDTVWSQYTLVDHIPPLNGKVRKLYRDVKNKYTPAELLELYTRKMSKMKNVFVNTYGEGDNLKIYLSQTNELYLRDKYETTDYHKVLENNTIGGHYVDKVRIYNQLTFSKKNENDDPHTNRVKYFDNHFGEGEWMEYDIRKSQLTILKFLMEHPDVLNDNWYWLTKNFGAYLFKNLKDKVQNKPSLGNIKVREVQYKNAINKPIILEPIYSEISWESVLDDFNGDIKKAKEFVSVSPNKKHLRKAESLVMDKYPEFERFVKILQRIHPALPHFIFATFERRLIHNRISKTLLDYNIPVKVVHDAIFFAKDDKDIVDQVIEHSMTDFYNILDWCGGDIECMFSTKTDDMLSEASDSSLTDDSPISDMNTPQEQNKASEEENKKTKQELVDDIETRWVDGKLYEIVNGRIGPQVQKELASLIG